MTPTPSRRDGLAIGDLPAPGAGAVAALGDALLVDLRDDLAVAGQQRLGRAHLGAERQFAFGQTIGAVLLEFGQRAVCLRPARAVGAFVHLAARAEVADPGILRRAERAGVEAIAAPDAQVLGVQDHAVGGGIEAVHRADRLAGCVGAVHAGHGDRALARLAVVDGDDAPAVDTPRHFMLVLAGSDASVALDATVGVAEKFHPSHCRASLSGLDLTERGFGLLHPGDGIEPISRDRVHALAEHDRIAALRIFAALVDVLEPAGEVERAPGHAFADALGDERLHASGLSAFHLRPPDEDPTAVPDAALGRVGRIDLDEHVLLQFGEPFVGTRLLAAALVLHEAAGGENQRELLGNSLLHVRLLHREAGVRQTELLGVGQRRIFGDEIGPRRIDRLTVHRNRIGQVPRVGASLAVAVVDAAVRQGHPLDAAGEVDRPGHAIGTVAADALDHRFLGRGEILVPTELLEHPIGEFGVAVLDLRAERIGAFGEKIVLARATVGQLDLALHAEAGTECAAAIHHVQIGVVERVGARMLEFGRSPARPRQAVIIAFSRTVLGPQADELEVLLVGHVELEALRRLAAIAGRPATTIDLAQDVLGDGLGALDLDVLEHAVSEAQPLRQQIHDL